MKNPFMERAIQLAIENVRSGRGGPFAALVVSDGRILGTGTNTVTSSNDPTAHAEIVAIRAACTALGSFQLHKCDLYCTCEPCPMCLGAIYWSRLQRVFFGAEVGDAARAGFDDSFIYQQIDTVREKRSIPFLPLMREEALECFREWKEKADRVPY